MYLSTLYCLNRYDMRYFIVVLILVFSSFSQQVFAASKAENGQPRKRVAVVLSGGGARGMAHIGALKVIEEAGIPIDYVVGTSMGSIIGGLYSIGYTSTQLDSMVKKQDWMFLLSDRIRRNDASFTAKEQIDKYLITIPFGGDKKMGSSAGLIRGQNLDNLFYNLTFGYHDPISFDTLPVPFACVAVDAVDGGEHVLNHGVLPVAMRASMAIPGVFAPVRLDSMVLVDGGVANNYPVDIAREMGADLVIGVDVRPDMKTAGELKSTADVLGQIMDFYGLDKYQRNVNQTDTYIKVNVKGYSSASFTPVAVDSLIARGEEAARIHWEDLLRLKEKIGIDSSYIVKHEPYRVWEERDSFFVYTIYFDSVHQHLKDKHLLKICHLKENRKISMADLQKAVSCLYATEQYDGVSYKLASQKDGYDLSFELRRKQENVVRAGFRFDSEEVASALLGATLKLKTSFPSQLMLTGRLGKRSSIRGDYTIGTAFSGNVNVAYSFQYNDINIYDEGARSYNITYAYNFAEFAFLKTLGNRMKCSLGLHFENYDYKGVLSNGTATNIPVDSDIFLSYFISLYYDNFNKRYFPSRGAMMKIDYSLYTDNMTTYKKKAPFSAFSLAYRVALGITDRFAILPSISTRALIGRNIAYPYYNMIGGDIMGHYSPQQLPFAGINNVEFCQRSVVITGATFRYKIGQNNYLSLTANCGVSNDRFQQLLSDDNEVLVGGSIGYGYDSIAGPLEFSFNFSNRTEKLGYFLNIGYVF